MACHSVPFTAELALCGGTSKSLSIAHTAKNAEMSRESDSNPVDRAVHFPY